MSKIDRVPPIVRDYLEKAKTQLEYRGRLEDIVEVIQESLKALEKTKRSPKKR